MPVSLPAALLCALLPAAPASPVAARPSFVPAEIAAADAPPIDAFGTHCVVALANRRFAEASPHFSEVYAGRTYFFASEAARRTFVENPDAYAPAWCGIDPVAYLDDDALVEGSVLRRHAGRFYLFTTVAHWNTFRAAPGRYAR